MDTAVETRRGIVRTVIMNHLLSCTFCFLVIVFAFQWAYAMDKGIIILFTGTSIFYFSGIYSYVYDQPKLDLILRGKYDYLMPLKTGGFASALIFLFTGVQFIMHTVSPFHADLYGIIARFANYQFFYFLYGPDGNYHNVPALILYLILPIAVAYLAYFMGIKKFSFLKLYTKMLYKKRK